MNRSRMIFAALACMIPIGLVYLFPHASYSVRTPGGGSGTQWGFLPRWQLEAAYGSSTGLFLIMMVNVLVASAAVVYYFGGPRLTDDESRGSKLTRNLGILYLLLGLPWMALGAGIYGSPLANSPSKSLIAALAALATGPFLVLPARYLVRQRRLRGLVLVGGGCLSAPLLAYGINQLSDLLFPFLLVITLPMVALGWYQLLRSGGQQDELSRFIIRETLKSPIAWGGYAVAVLPVSYFLAGWPRLVMPTTYWIILLLVFFSAALFHTSFKIVRDESRRQR